MVAAAGGAAAAVGVADARTLRRRGLGAGPQASAGAALSWLPDPLPSRHLADPAAVPVCLLSGDTAVVARGDNNVYVGKDGQVYRRSEGGGWQQYEGGQWSGAAASRVDSSTVQSLNRDAEARATGATRASQSQSWRSSGGGGGFSGGGLGGGGMGGMRGGGGGRRR